jgi:hypothetical protein
MLNSASINICKNYTLVEPNFELTNFVLYPNPNKGNFTLQFISTSKSGIKIVHDVLGRKIFEKAMSYSGNMIMQNIQLVNTQPGLLLLTIIDGSKRKSKDTDSVVYILFSVV